MQPEDRVNTDMFERHFKIPSLHQPQAFQACGSELAAGATVAQSSTLAAWGHFQEEQFHWSQREEKTLGWTQEVPVSHGAGGPQHFWRGDWGKMRGGGKQGDMWT